MKRKCKSSGYISAHYVLWEEQVNHFAALVLKMIKQRETQT